MTIEEFFKANNKAALAFSGGTDSAYLLYEGKRCGADIHPYFVKAQFQPQFELDDARRLADELGIKLTIIYADVLSCAEVTANPANRCYFCKKQIFSTIIKTASDDGYDIVIDGTNASDDLNDRPGAKALAEFGVLSPLRICGITKPELRKRSVEAGLFTGKKPSYACLATRIKTGEEITADKLAAVEVCENYLFSLGFSDFRVRTDNWKATLQLPADQMKRAYEHEEQIKQMLLKYYSNVEFGLRR